MNFTLKYELDIISRSVNRSLKKYLYSFWFKSRCVKFYSFGPAWGTDVFYLFHLHFFLLFKIDFSFCFVVINFASALCKNVFAALFLNSFPCFL